MTKEILRKCQGCLKLINRDELIKITKLSKTSNPNVIFEITLIGEQNNRDLEKFKSEFID